MEVVLACLLADVLEYVFVIVVWFLFTYGSSLSYFQYLLTDKKSGLGNFILCVTMELSSLVTDLVSKRMWRVRTFIACLPYLTFSGDVKSQSWVITMTHLCMCVLERFDIKKFDTIFSVFHVSAGLLLLSVTWQMNLMCKLLLIGIISDFATTSICTLLKTCFDFF